MSSDAIEKNNKELHTMCFESMNSSQMLLIDLNKSYFGHVLTISMAIMGLVIPLLLNKGFSTNLNIISRIGFSISVILSIFLYIIGIKLQKREVVYRKKMVDICQNNLYDDSTRHLFPSKMREIVQEYSNESDGKLLVKLDSILYTCLNIVFVVSLIVFLIGLMLMK